MKTKIRRIVVLLIIGLSLCNAGFAETWTEFLVRQNTWLLQNPEPMNQALMLKFVDEENFLSIGIFMDTNNKETESGTYEISGGNDDPIITLTLGGTVNSFKLKYVNESKIIFVGKKERIFAVFQSSEDHYVDNLVKEKKKQTNVNTDITYPIPVTPVYTPTQHACQSCRTTGRCGGCNGTGKVAGYPYGTYTPCWVCSGTGTCKFCGGTGYLYYGLFINFKIENCGFFPQFFFLIVILNSYYGHKIQDMYILD